MRDDNQPLPQEYLGDGVYVHEDEAAQLWLSTERGLAGRLDSIALDYYTMAALLTYAAKSERWRTVILGAIKPFAPSLDLRADTKDES